MPIGRPSKYQPAYAEEVVTYCARGYSLTAFAGYIGVCRDTISEWCAEHPAFSVAVKRAKAKRAAWWEDRARQVAESGGPGGQATMVIFGLKNHAPEDYSDKTQHEISGRNGGPVEMTIEDKRVAAQAILDGVFGKESDEGH